MVVFLQIFLLLNVFAAGFLAAFGVRHYQAHLHQKRGGEADHHDPAEVRLPPAVRKQLLETAALNYQHILDQAGAELKNDLSAASAELSSKVHELSGSTFGSEMERYQAELGELRKQTLLSIGSSMAEVAQQEAALKTQLAEDVAIERKRLVNLIDTKLADAVSSFLVEALGHNVDLGAQEPYLMKLLDDHKAELVEKVDD